MLDFWSFRHEAAALGTALCWSITPLLSSIASRHLGALAFSRLRQISVALLLAVFVAATGRWQDLSRHDIVVLLVSGVIGIFVGDTLLFLCLNRLGPRRSSVLFALNAPIAAFLGWLWLGERLSMEAVLGIGLACVGVILAILFGRRSEQVHAFESIKGTLWFGVALGLCAAAGQATGSLIARPLMAAGVDPFVASMLRVGAAGACLTAMMSLPYDVLKPQNPLTLRVAALTIGSGVLAMGVGDGCWHDLAAVCLVRWQGWHCFDTLSHIACDDPAFAVDDHKAKASGGGMGRRWPCGYRTCLALCRACLDLMPAGQGCRGHRGFQQSRWS